MTLTALRAASLNLQQIAADLVASGSLEMNADRAADAKAVASVLPVGTRVYVNHLPRHNFDQSLEALRALREAGLEPVPHIAARRIQSRMQVRRYLERAVGEARVSRALIIGGDTDRPSGPYADAAALLRDGIIADSGIREVSLAGYPEGHPRIATAILVQALDEKLALARGQGLAAHVLTQFSFAPVRIVEYCTELARRMPGLPVIVGLAGPTEPMRLLRFAQRCGVSASLRALSSQGFGAVKLITNTDPSGQLQALARLYAAHPACNVVGVHMFSFGGAAQTAAWMNGVITAPRP